jgi:hypothetical protein
VQRAGCVGSRKSERRCYIPGFKVVPVTEFEHASVTGAQLLHGLPEPIRILLVLVPRNGNVGARILRSDSGLAKELDATHPSRCIEQAQVCNGDQAMDQFVG